MNKINTVQEFADNINARGPGSGRPFEEILGDILPAEVFKEWQHAMLTQALKISASPEEQAELFERLGVDDPDPEDVLTATMTVALERATNAAFAAGLFTGLAALDDEGFLKFERKNGWDNIPPAE